MLIDLLGSLLLFSNLMTLFLILVFVYCFLLFLMELNKHTHHENTVLLKKNTCFSSVFFFPLEQ